MKREEFKKIADKVYLGIASDEELASYNFYYNLYQAQQAPDAIVDTVIGDTIYTRLSSQLDQEERKVRQFKLRQIYFQVASAAAVLIMVSYFAFQYRFQQSSVKPVEIAARTASSENYLVQLPDGSTVILSNGSTLKYAPTLADDTSRDVYLTGKGFFDIKHDASKPFIVHTGEVKTRVLGTAFDVNSPNAGKDVFVRVIRGKVEVSTGLSLLGTLTPGKQIAYNVKQKRAIMSSIDAERATEWKEEDLVFNDMSFEDASRLLEVRFGVTIKIADEELAERRFTTTLYEKQSLEEFLSLICDFNQASFKVLPGGKDVLIESSN
ncbi:FecR family protein [Desertivirga brevis]|uniref:FecR family protein n=1 Tax=Desertivirga brevis TaxID=2810310 RepID=UPI001A9798BC|nr:FecR domain-containing protein [Pedobacter sp. SYSU D00873]